MDARQFRANRSHPDGVRLTVADPDFAAQMAVARRIMKERREVLRELAK